MRRTTGLMAMLALGAVLALSVVPHAQSKAEDALRAAIETETIKGDLKAAIEQYKVLASGPDRAVAAKALVQLGECYQKQGNAESRNAWQKVVKDFPDQKDAVAEARKRLAGLALGSTGAVTSIPGTLRQLYQGTGHPVPGLPSYVSPDGRYVVFPPIRATPQAFVIRDLVDRRELRVPHASPESLIAGWRASPTEQVTATVSFVGVLPNQNRCVYAVFLGATENGRIGRRRQQQLRTVRFDGSDDRIIMKLDNQPAEFPILSRDGRTILTALWTAGAGAAEEVVAASVRLSDGALTRLAPPVKLQTGDYVMFPSADGRLMAVWQFQEGGKEAIAVIDTQTRKRTQIEEVSKDEQLDFVPDWTADGGLVFSVRSEESSRIYMARRTGPGEIGPPELIKSIVGRVRLARVGGDGTVYYAAERERNDFYTVPLDLQTGRVAGQPALVPGLSGACGLEWSRDGASITYAARMNRGDESAPCTLIVIRNVADGRERVLSPGFTALQRPRWSPDQTRLVVFGQKDGKYGVFLVDPVTNSAELVIEADQNQITGDNILAADWTPNGRALILGRLDRSTQDYRDARWRIVRHDLQTGGESELYSIRNAELPGGRIFFGVTSFSRDGSACLMINEPKGDRAAVYLPAAGAPARTVFSVPADRRFAWSAITSDGRAIYVPERTADDAAANTRKLVRVPVGGGEPIDAGLALPGLDTLAPSPDGTRLIFKAWENVVQVWAIDRLLAPTPKVEPPAKPPSTAKLAAAASPASRK